MSSVLNKPSALFIMPNLSPGGIQKQVVLLARYLKKGLGFNVHIWGTNTLSDDYVGKLRSEGFIIAKHSEIINFRSEAYAKLSFIDKMKQWQQLIKDIRATKAHVIFPYTPAIDEVVNKIWMLTTAKLTFSFERGGHLNPTAKKMSSLECISRLYKPVYVANSEHGRKALSIMQAVPPHNIHVIRNAYIPSADNSIEDWQKDSEKYDETLVITMIANFFNEKDHITVINAVKELSKKYQFMLLLAGKGSGQYCEQNYLKSSALVEQLGLQNVVSFLGNVNNINALLKVTDIGLLSSRTEGCPNAILEYMGASLPVIGTNIPGIREVVSNDNLPFLYETGNVNDCANKLEKLISNEGIRKELGQNNLKHIQANFTPENMYIRYKTLLKNKIPDINES
ncbi:glycosyltransferase family 4 protein [Carboxylicivirga mesophila]|uniref:Glycosyltransferase family 4 protein n=1 Tax=Carboxylicivirga mesophila TaxID=1166478 RepID=A0ABS5KAS7_9BACT|nr:glycosyltransferase family 4 protein [Carboxylicivirga mesophila]MBS2212129.1 glycosyltransferase family 4 protein [Carboxylicivirga mesophila]